MIIRENVSLAPYTTFNIGGLARYFAEIKNDEELTQAFVFAETQQLPVFVLGAGSNVLVSDDGFAGVVIHPVNSDVHYEDGGEEVLVVSGAGKNWDELVGEVVDLGLWGIENLSGIPSSVGATPVQNIGAYGVEVENVIAWVDVYDHVRHAVRRLSHDDCEFGYRESIFKHEQGSSLVVIRVAYRLRKNGTPNLSYKDLHTYHEEIHPLEKLQDVRGAVLTIRAKKFPQKEEAGTAGSFFKNPIVTSEFASSFLERFPTAPSYPQKDGNYKLSAAWIIDHALSMKGAREGNVGTWEAQALILVNYGSAHAAEVMRFSNQIISSCVREIGLELEPEVVCVGEINFEN